MLSCCCDKVDDDIDNEQQYPLDGVAPGYLLTLVDSLIDKFGNDRAMEMTTYEVYNSVIMPNTKEQKIPYIDLARNIIVPDAWKEGTQPAVGKANHFISHAWGYKFCDLVEAVAHWTDTNLRREEIKSSYLWVDILSVNQHTPKPDGFWDKAFSYGVKTIGHTILVLKPPLEPVALTRIWCIWEIFNTVNQDIPLDVAMTRRDQDLYKTACEDDFPSIISALGKIDAVAAQSSQPEDKVRILQTVENGNIGVNGFNNQCRLALLSFLLIEMTRMGRMEEANELLDEGANPNSGTCPPLHEASYEGYLDLAKMLVERGADPDKLDSAGWTPISCACECGHLEMVKWYVETCKVNLEYRDWDGNRPLENASRYGNHEIADYLRTQMEKE